MDQQNFKKFIITSRSDFAIYLRFLIIGTYRSLKKYNLYVEQLGEKIQELDLENKPKTPIDSEIYEEFNDKIQRVSNKLLNLFGDLQSDSLSYYKFRKQLVKRNIEVKKDLGELSELIWKNLSRANEARNWGLHEPESLLNAHFENIEKLWTREEFERYKTEFTTVNIANFNKYEGSWLISLHRECENNQRLYNELYNSMLSDYTLLIGTSPEIKEVDYHTRPLDIELMIPKTSFLMQQKKYKK
ncbi:hypothetical protein [Lysinibacillus odysseyi]|uniref:Uncharacterized protein n=1 Tax=Lysinibacillus odysseyi 34hs-1 = NBRC 100172 TaxID=1220589 RepID=A0A0A3J172_9BACI|nr:hypothetical protein [Lysinibacillus odysseyi]KGR89470.1 hypothetical protein CD32_00300 [Lysinibacillus odysseyi 34hs-1 = NBRC 100172]